MRETLLQSDAEPHCETRGDIMFLPAFYCVPLYVCMCVCRARARAEPRRRVACALQRKNRGTEQQVQKPHRHCRCAFVAIFCSTPTISICACDVVKSEPIEKQLCDPNSYLMKNVRNHGGNHLAMNVSAVASGVPPEFHSAYEEIFNEFNDCKDVKPHFGLMYPGTSDNLRNWLLNDVKMENGLTSRYRLTNDEMSQFKADPYDLGGKDMRMNNNNKFNHMMGQQAAAAAAMMDKQRLGAAAVVGSSVGGIGPSPAGVGLSAPGVAGVGLKDPTDLPKCDECNKTFTQRSKLKQHVEIVHRSIRAHECDLCLKKFGYKNHLMKHIDTVHRGIKAFECTVCHKVFGVKGTLKRHVTTVHGETKTEFECTACRSVYTSGSGVNLKRQNARAFDCDACHKSFGRKDTLNNHVDMVHRGVRTAIRAFECQVCHKTFTRNDHLKTHIDAVHLGIKAHKCEVCHESFARKGDLNRHVDTIHRAIKLTRVRGVPQELWT
uniref:C2H2-type domain-containing protein n=1 Tax=Trichogramma kaykai TaxID=54128 RepID=A0ABD2WM30_9HYME